MGLALGLSITAGSGNLLAQQPAPAAPGQPPQASTPGVGTITHLSGTLAVRKTDGATRFLSVNSPISEGDTLATQQGTYARIKFADGGEVVMRPETQFRVDNFHYDEQKPQSDTMLVSLLKGGMRAVTGLIGKRNRDKISYATPTATVGIRGTNWGALFCENNCGGYQAPGGSTPQNGLYVDVTSGSIVVTNPQGSQQFQPGQFGFVGTNQPPVILPPGQGIQVTMPQSISKNTGGGSTVGGGRSDSECVL
jgi:hypothetical protein